LRFFYIKTLKKAWSVAETPYPKKNHHLPAILSQEEVARLSDAAETPFHRTLLMTLYATGLRRAEVTHLKVSDIDSQRMVIHVRGGKGRKDRDVMLSPRLLEELRQHWRRLREKPTTGSSPATVGIRLLTRSMRKRYTTLAKEPRSARALTVPSILTPCAIALPLICSKPAPICAPFRSC
jgi:site-specific recombinase XerD